MRLIFTCCHPGLAQEAQIVLTLREICGLTTEAIAKAFLIPPPTLAQRIVRAKTKIRDAGIPYEVPEEKQLPERLQRVLQVIYLVFNEGDSSSSGDALIRQELCNEAMRLTRFLLQLLTPRQQTASAPMLAEIQGLLAGFYILEAPDLNEALQLAEKTPPARYGSIEIRPVRELKNQGNSGVNR